MDKVLKKRAETEGKPAANPKFLWPKPQLIKLKLSQSASATETAKNHRVLTCYGQYYDPLAMINNIPTFYADYADQVQVPEAQPYTLPDWMARTPSLYPRILYTNFLVRFITLMGKSSSSGFFYAMMRT